MLLSFSIPTYNRGKLIGETLTSIINEVKKFNLENQCSINVFDNCSEDNTVEVSKSLLSGSGINYKVYESEFNLGAELNFDRCIRLPNAKYCWIFGSDDMLKKEALIDVFKYLNLIKPKGGVTINYQIIYDNFKKSKLKLFTPELGKNSFLLNGLEKDKLSSKDRKRLISLTLGYMPFISSTIISRDKYCKYVKEPKLLNKEGYDFIPWFFQVFKNSSWSYTGITGVICRRDETNLDDASGFYGKDASNAYKVNIALFKIMKNEFKYLNSNTLLNESIRAYSYRYIVGDLIRMKLNFINNTNLKNSLNKYIDSVRSQYLRKNFSFTFTFIKILSFIDPSFFRFLKKIYNQVK